MTFRPRRSALYIPGSNGRALEKARTLATDALILDLEDAVAPEAKELARHFVAEQVRAGGYGQREIVIRVNGANTPWRREDMAMAASVGPHAVLVPKVSSPGDIMMAAKELREAGVPGHTRLWAMIETPVALMNIDAVARSSVDPAARLDVFVMGTNDLARETRARILPGRGPMLPWLSLCLAAARAHGVEILDGVYNDITNEAGFRAECEQGRDLGMDGKTLIHPSQLGPCNEIFAPGAAETEQALKIIAAFARPENARKGAILLDGRMVELLHAEMARRTCAIAEAIAGRVAEAVKR